MAGWLDDILRQARERPHAPAAVTSHWAVRYGKLARWVDAASRSLIRLGIAPGQRCALTLEQTPQHLALILAVARVGGVSLPLPLQWPPETRREVAQNLGAVLHLGQGSEDALPDVPFQLADAKFFSPQHGPELPAGDVSENGPARIFVSASGGVAPRAVECSHAGLAHRMHQSIRDGGLAASARVLGENLNYSFLVPALAALSRGGTVVLPGFGAEGLLHALVASAVSHARLSAISASGVLQLLGEDRVELPGLQRLEVVGDTVPAGQVAALRHQLSANLWTLYAPMETGVVAAASPAQLTRSPATAGQPVQDAEIHIVDGEGRSVQPGKPGELRLRVPFMPADYVDAPATSRQRFSDGWFYPGTTARLASDGLLSLDPA